MAADFFVVPTSIHRAIAVPADGRVVAIPQVGGLQHRHGRQAA